jgi:4-hydroxybenzoate polyprenyltransferase
MSDREDDLKIGINSSALFFGDRAAAAVGVFFAATALLLACLGVLSNLQPIFWLAWGIASIGWIWQYIRLRQQDLPKPVYGKIFRENVGVGFILLAGMILGSIF